MEQTFDILKTIIFLFRLEVSTLKLGYFGPNVLFLQLKTLYPRLKTAI